MPVKPIFGSYPFLKIARDSGLRYETVLAVADMYIHGRAPNSPDSVEISMMDLTTVQAYRESILIAAQNFKKIQTEGWDQNA